VTTRFVVDTSAVLSTGAKILQAFPDAEVIIPLAVLQELEKKRLDPLVGAAARSCLRELDSLRGRGDLRTGVDNGVATIRVEINHVSAADLPDTVKNDRSTDTRIIAVAKSLGATLISNDLPMRILASVVGVAAGDVPSSIRYDSSLDDLKVVHVDNSIIEDLYAHGHVKADFDIPVNASAVLKSHDESLSALAVQRKGWDLRLVENLTVSSVSGRSAEQTVAISHLVNPDVPIISLMGAAGTGKTMLSLAAGLHLVESKDSPIDRVIVFRPLHAVGGRSLGYLPGDALEKMSVWADAVIDACDAFMPRSRVERLIKDGKLEVLPVEHIRGRTFTNSFLVLDESQNHEYNVLLTAITRLGRGSKIVLTSDPAQVDNTYVRNAEGVREVIQRLSGDKLFAHVALKKSERSEAAAVAAKLLGDPA
jgi:PhoH-like ATPase